MSGKEGKGGKIKVEVIVDNREKEFVKAFSGMESFRFENMDVGDFKIGDSVYIERKTFSDLATSIKDGRYREQKVRLKSLVNCKVIYLIEDDKMLRNGRVCGMPVSTLMGAMSKCMLRDGFFVYQSSGVTESVKFIEKVKKQMEAGELGSSISGGGEKVDKVDKVDKDNAYLSVIKTEKKANMTEEMCYLAQLKQIPGVSGGGAMAIKERYGSMKAIFEGFRKIDEIKDFSGNLTDEDRLKAKRLMFSDIKNGGRKLGKVTSEKIYRYLCGDT